MQSENEMNIGKLNWTKNIWVEGTFDVAIQIDLELIFGKSIATSRSKI